MKRLFYCFLFFLLGYLTVSAHAQKSRPVVQTNKQINTFYLHDVELLESPFLHAQEQDKKYLLALRADRLLAPFQREAGLPQKAESYTNWENTGLDGHIGGHYLSALSLMFASTGDKEIKARLDYMIDALKSCQDANRNGYIGGVPGGKAIWEEVEAGNIRAGKFNLNGKWVPLYNIHKTYAGLRDAWLYTKNEKAKEMLVKMTDWAIRLVAQLSEKQIQDMLRSEYGGLNETFADVAAITGEEKYLHLAHQFSHHSILQPLLSNEDKLNGLHANTQIPKVIGFKRIADLEDNHDWEKAAAFFWDTVVNNRSVSIGGNSVNEQFHSINDFSKMINSIHGPETCNTYNMLRLSKMLYETSVDKKYIEYYERALYNHILSTQHPENGGLVYFTSMRPGHYKVYSQPQTSMWCCVGSGIENHAKYGEMIYAHTQDELFVNLFIPSRLRWKEKNTEVIQENRFPEEARTTLRINPAKATRFTLQLRYPDWQEAGKLKILVNGKEQKVQRNENGYVSLNRKWKRNDQVEVLMSMQIYTEQMPDKSNYYSFFYGPVVLAAKTGTEDLRGLYADDSRKAHEARGRRISLSEMPILVGEADKLTNSLTPVPGKPLSFRLSNLYPENKWQGMELVPFFSIHDSRYIVYWQQTTPENIAALQKITDELEKERARLDAITIDELSCGQQQPESDHFIQMENSETGYTAENHWRDAGGWFSYQLQNRDKKAAYLYITYFDQESNRQSDIFLNEEKITSLSLKGGNGEQVFEAIYPIPENLQDKQILSLRFEAKGEGRTAQITQVRLLESKQSLAYTTVYQTDGEWIKGENLNRYNNRPLYINNGNGFVLAGDKPLIRLVQGDRLIGNLVVSVKRGNGVKTIYDFDQITSLYAPGQMKWEISDSQLKGINLTLHVLPASSGTGMVVRIETKKMKSEDELSWRFGGEKKYSKKRLNFEFDLMGHPELIDWNEVGNNDVPSLFQGQFQKKETDVLTLSFHLDSQGEILCESGEKAELNYKQAENKLESVVGRMKISTPDPYLDAAAKVSVFAVDGTWYPPVFVHGGMLWNSPLPGWRTVFGGTMYGWHDRVLEQAKHYIATQVKESEKKIPKADPASLLTLQHADSRFYGKGRIIKDQKRYNMQSQLFDQLIEEYRWTADPELIKILREALELHLEWLQECFDPDGDGVYESFLNTWPTDSQWYNGGGTAEETSYAYRAHLAARDMARNAGDRKAEKRHQQMLEKIKKGFFDKLWIVSKGHSGAYREQGGHGRLHENPWLYSIFLPVDAGLTSQTQALESVYYSEWALQNDTLPSSGGRQVWTSNWVPGTWSIRERWIGDNYHLALAYFQAGLPEDAWNIMKACYLHTAFDHLVPGNFGGQQGGTDFGDCVHMFSRTLVSGLFGFNPDYPNHQVNISPNFPKDWDHASIELPDVSIAFKRNKTKQTYTFKLPRKADMLLALPVQSNEIKEVLLNGEPIAWKMEPGVGCTRIVIKVKDTDQADISIKQADLLPYHAPLLVEGNVGDLVSFTAKDAQIISFEDPQKAVENGSIQNGILQARLTGNKGYHTLIAKVTTGKMPQYRVFRIKINDPEGDTKEAARYVETIPEEAYWKTVDIRSLHNADVRTIYKQEYISPRPNTVSVRLGTDGYSPWTFPIWKSKAPEIKTDQVLRMMNEDKLLLTPQGVPFKWNTGNQNITFTSMWDNYPVKVSFPVKETGDAIFFLVAGSTNVMQCDIANAVIRLNYANGTTDSLELIPPINYWNLCPIYYKATSPEQGSRNDYTSEIDRFVIPDKLPETVQLGENCRAMLLNLKMPKGVELESIMLEALSQEVVVGLIGVSIMSKE
jgi:DUF1680 family protein